MRRSTYPRHSFEGVTPSAMRNVVRHLALQDRGDALEPHAGVDRRPRQRRHRAARVAVELHEDEVPDLEPPVALARGAEAPAARGFPGAREMVALVEVDLRARAARPRVAHRPEVVLLAEPEDVGVAEPGHLLPQRVRLVVVGEDGRPEPARVEAEVAREELPGELDRVGLEVIAEREVAEHLEERVMARRAPDVLEVVVLAARAHALLAARGTHIVAPFLAEEDRLELDHAGVGEEERRVVAGHERGRAHARVALRLEILEEPFAELGAGHRSANCTIGPRSPPDPRRLNGSEGEGRSKTRYYTSRAARSSWAADGERARSPDRFNVCPSPTQGGRFTECPVLTFSLNPSREGFHRSRGPDQWRWGIFSHTAAHHLISGREPTR